MGLATEYSHDFSGNRIAVSNWNAEESSYEVFLGPDLIPSSDGYILMQSVEVLRDSLEEYDPKFEEVLRLAAAVAVVFHKKGCGQNTPEQMVRHYWNTWRNEILLQQGKTRQKKVTELINSLTKLFGFHSDDIAFLSRL